MARKWLGGGVGRLWWAEKSPANPIEQPAELNEAVLNTIGYVLSRYGRLSARDPEHMTHAAWARQR